MGPTLSPSSSSFPPTPTASIESNPTTPLVPALFVIGDSSVDCGTNNFLGTFARADRLPYGRDFDTHQPTGRFCNGRIPVDYHGFNETTDACCGLGEHKGFVMCLSPDMACNDASNHVWWDQFHPTDAVNAILADNVWNGLHTKMCYPINLRDMVVSSSY
ncbi:hypothetical protein C1H46_012598 [Malus baccata]|uniref:GDSL esterase/lipase n=1 Tax=Malus baccata TaxID=106549 RepID=A0A540MSP7_MALBA|nr:hypothetical protein C1H46_012598 [Malus baccata]